MTCVFFLDAIRDHPFSAYAKFFEKATFLLNIFDSK